MSVSKFFLLFFLTLGISRLLSQEIGKQLWKRALEGQMIKSAGAATNGRIYLLSDDRALQAIDEVTGKRLWITRPGKKLQPLLMIGSDLTLYVTDEEDTFFAINQGGAGRWRLNLPSSLSAEPAASVSGDVYLPLTNGTLLTLDRYGKRKWSYDTKGYIAVPPIIDRYGRISLPLLEKRLQLLAVDGALLNEEILPFVPTHQIGFSDDLIIGGEGGRIIRITVEGEVLFDVSLSSTARIVTLLANDGGELFILQIDGLLTVLNGDGAILYSEPLPPPTSDAVLDNQGYLHYPTTEDSFFIWRGEREKEVIVDGLSGRGILTSSGKIIAAANGWYVGAYQGNPPARGWAQKRGDSRYSGSLFHFMVPTQKRQFYKDDESYKMWVSLAESDDLADKRSVLNSLRKFKTKEELVTALPFYDLLLDTLGEGSSKGPTDYADVDIKTQAYSMMGSLEEVVFYGSLINAMKREEETSVLASAIKAFGDIRFDPWGEGLETISTAVLKRPNLESEEVLLVAAVEAIEKLLLYNGALPGNRIYHLLNASIYFSVSDEADKRITRVRNRLLSAPVPKRY